MKNFKKISRFFDQNLFGKLAFFTIFTKYFLDFWLRSESIDLWKITPDFYNNLSDFGGGVLPPSPLRTPLHIYNTIQYNTYIKTIRISRLLIFRRKPYKNSIFRWIFPDFLSVLLCPIIVLLCRVLLLLACVLSLIMFEQG